MKKIYYIYVVLILCILLTPVLTMNHKKKLVSELDNTYYPEFPSQFDETTFSQIDEYIKKRIGLRNEAIYVYTKCLDKCFHEAWPNTYNYGKEGYVFPNSEILVKDYQRLNVKQSAEMTDALAEYFNNVNKYLQKKDILFLTFFAPEKHTIYPEYYSDSIYVYDDRANMDVFCEKIEKNNTPYIYPFEKFMEEKKKAQIYNQKFDPYHWNDLGNFIANQMIDEYIQERTDNLESLRLEQFELKYELRKNLLESYLEVNEEVPVYYLKENNGIENISENDMFLIENVVKSQEHYINTDKPSAPSILIFHDSYFGGSAKYYIGRYSEVISVHGANYAKMQELVEHYNPDIVLFESTERVTYTDSELWNIESLRNWNAN